MTRVLVLGRRGQLARALLASAPQAFDVLSAGRDECDLTNGDAVRAYVGRVRPDVLINAAAYTAVDKAESDESAAFAVNAEAPRVMAEALADFGGMFVHVSTDYVFEGDGTVPYREDDAVASPPASVYGRSKLAGERAVLETIAEHYIVRTSWVFDAAGQNFVRTMLRLGRERDEVRVVADQHGRPTYAPDLADAIWRLVERRPAFGTYHFANEGATTWHGLAGAVFGELSRREGKAPRLVAIGTADYPTPAKRPTYSVLDTTKFERALGTPIRGWREALTQCVDEMREDAR